MAKVFGEVAYEQVHIMSSNAKKAAQDELDAAKKKGATKSELDRLQANVDAWGESGINKIALHATVGGLMSQMGGSGFASGAVGAGINEAAQKVLSNIKDPGLHQIASALLGAAAAKVAGGNAQAGASTAASGTKNNFYLVVHYGLENALKKTLAEQYGISGDKANEIVSEVKDYFTSEISKQDKEREYESQDNQSYSDSACREKLYSKVLGASDIATANSFIADYDILMEGLRNTATVDALKEAGHTSMMIAGAWVTFEGMLVEGAWVVTNYKIVRNASQGASKATTAIADEVKVLSESPWIQGPVTRGNIIDDALGNNLGRTFPTVDKLENGVLTSTKSLDVMAKTYQSESAMFNRFKN